MVGNILREVTLGEPVPSNNQLNQAGRRIRKRLEPETLELDGEQAAEDKHLAMRWRSMHSLALTKTRVGLGACVMRSLRADSQAQLVTQRLKRYDSIVAKLRRDKPRLSEIRDIAGCRAVVPGLPEVAEVWACIDRARKMTIDDTRDYNTNPHFGGYRALHLWCRRDGFKVEVQLRTARQQQWAELVEEWDTTLSTDIKHESAPEPALRYFRLLSDFFYQLDHDLDPEELDTSMLTEATVDVRGWLEEVLHDRQ